AAARENLPPQVIQRVAREIRQLVVTPLDGIRYLPQDDEQLTEIRAEIQGPENTPYEGGFFRIKLVLSDGFPQTPPRGVFLTKIFHPNIATNGDVCVNTLKKDWSPQLGIAHVLQVIRCLLIVPFPESSLNDEAGRLFMESYEEYARRARIWTNIHAPKESASPKPEEDDAQHSDTEAATTPDTPTPAGQTLPGSPSSKAKELSDSDVDTKAAPATPLKTKSATLLAKSPVATASAPTQSISAPSSTKKRTSSNAADIATSLKKKNTKKKGIKRL
uniref:E2 ubiquitin-conjugating enzyme n=1 Tax=Globisporangium ultimum (strain ATCC 200006 / CBS 805.95 / DAOM BR144) TaxID=431595 RepID=K3WZA4_GLOUD